MDNVLDNPGWNALISGNKTLANGNETIKYFSPDVSPFVCLNENSTENINALYGIVPEAEYYALISTAEIEIPAPWKIQVCAKAFQMVYNGDVTPVETIAKLVPLTDEHIPQMLALTKLTRPGPFEERTIDFGHYRGIFDGGKLVAMAGQRLNPTPYAEVSAVCTHPDHLGKGYARQLLMYHIQRIKAAGEIPFLHVRCNNERAVKVYEDIGFTKRREIYFYYLKKSA